MVRARDLVSWPLQLAQLAVLAAGLLGTAALVPRIDGLVPLHWGPAPFSGPGVPHRFSAASAPDGVGEPAKPGDGGLEPAGTPDPEGIDRWGAPAELYFVPAVGLVLLGTEWALAALIAGARVPQAQDPTVSSLELAWKRASVRLLEATFGALLVAIVAFGLWTARTATLGDTPRVAWLIAGLGAAVLPLVLLAPRAVRAQRALEARIGERVGQEFTTRQAWLVLVLLVGTPLVLLLFMALSARSG